MTVEQARSTPDGAAGLGGEPVVTIEDLTHRYGERVALAGVTLRINRGEIFGCLIGHLVMDVSGHEPLPAAGLHAGFILLLFIPLSRTLMLVTTLLDNDPIHHWRFILPLIQPPTSPH